LYSITPVFVCGAIVRWAVAPVVDGFTIVTEWFVAYTELLVPLSTRASTVANTNGGLWKVCPKLKLLLSTVVAVLSV
jgi:hypothetical protein